MVRLADDKTGLRYSSALVTLVALAMVGAAGACSRQVAPDKSAPDHYQAGLALLQAGEFDQAVGELAQVVAVYDDAADKLALALDSSVVVVPAGEFLMGSDAGDVDERPQQRIYLDAFVIDKYEVTNVQYQRFLLAMGQDGPQRFSGRYTQLIPTRNPDWQDAMYPPGEALYPVVGVTWQAAADYCAWAGKRLPTEAEWEKAARGADGRAYPWGEAWDEAQTNTGDAGVGYTQPVGLYRAGGSPYGALDMAGNAWEWVADLYDREYYRYMPDRNPPGPTSGTGERILRGGGWDSTPAQATTFYRNATHYFGSNFHVGFRCAGGWN